MNRTRALKWTITLTALLSIPALVFAFTFPGTGVSYTLAFDDGVGLTIQGTLSVAGSTADKAVFTSTSATPTPGIRAGLIIDGDYANASLNHALLKFEGISASPGMGNVPAVSVTNSIFYLQPDN